MNKYLVGFLTLVLLSASIYIFLPENVRIDVGKTYTTFKVWENNSWVTSGVEYTKLYDGTSLMRANNRVVNYTILGNTTNIYRYAYFKGGIIAIDTYTFDGNEKAVELFPISHNIQILNAKNKIFQYEVNNILYEGETKEITSPFSFGHKMKVEWEEGNYYSKVFQQKSQDKIIIKYKIDSDNFSKEVRLFDPLVQLVTPNTEVLSDSYVDSAAGDTNYGTSTNLYVLDSSAEDFYTYFMFNITGISTTNLEKVELFFYIPANSLDGATEGFNVSTHRVYPFPTYNISGVEWDEATLTFNNKPNETDHYDATFSDTKKYFGGVGEPIWWQNFNVTSIVLEDLNAGNLNTSIALIASNYFGSPATNDYIRITSKEGAEGSRPYLLFTYSGDSCSSSRCNFTSEHLLADVQVNDEPINQEYEIAMRWNVTELNDYSIDTVDSATLCLWLFNKLGTPDNDVRYHYFTNQTWDETVTTTAYDGFSKLNGTTTILNSTTTSTWSCFNITTAVTQNYNDGNDYLSFRVYDPDNLPDSTSSSISDSISFIGFGDVDGFTTTGYSFRPNENGLLSQRPTLTIKFTESIPETPPTVDFVSPTPNNETFTNIKNWSYINISCDKNCDGTLDWNGTNESMSGAGTLVNYVNKTNLAYGNYTFRVYVNNSADSSKKNATGQRWVFMNYTNPILTFIEPTPINENNSESSLYINVSCGGIPCTSILDWNGTNESMSQFNSAIWYKEKTGLIYGNYTYKVYANNSLDNDFKGVSDENWVFVNFTDVPSLVVIYPTINETELDRNFIRMHVEVFSSFEINNVTLYTNSSGSWNIAHEATLDTNTYTSDNTKGYILFERDLENGTYLFGAKTCNLAGCNSTSNFTVNLAWSTPETSIDGYYLFRIADRDETGGQYCRQWLDSSFFGTGQAGNGWDTGCIWKEPHIGNQDYQENLGSITEDVYCSQWLQYSFDETGNYTTVQDIDRVYCHLWATKSGGKLNDTYTSSIFGFNVWNKYAGYGDTEYERHLIHSIDTQSYPSVGNATGYELMIWDIEDFNYNVTGNDTYGFSFIFRPTQSSRIPQMTTFSNQKSFCIINPGDNLTLQGLDTDGDTISDFDEMFTYYTDPYDNNTDDDLWLDNEEILVSGVDPWNPFDSDYTTKYKITESGAAGWYGVINNSETYPTFFDFDNTLDAEFSGAEYTTLSSRSGSVTKKGEASDGNYSLIQVNTVFNITENLNQIIAINVFKSVDYGYSGDRSQSFSSIELLNISGTNLTFPGASQGFREFFVYRLLDGFSDVLENGKTIKVRDTFVANATLGGTVYPQISSIYNEVWVTREPVPEIKAPTTSVPYLGVVSGNIIPINFSWQYLQSGIEVINITFDDTLCPLEGVAEYIDTNTWQQNCTAPDMAGVVNVTMWVNHTDLSPLSITQEDAIYYTAADVNYSVAVPLGSIRFQNCSPDWNFYPSSPFGQDSDTPAINVTNNGTDTGGIQIEYIGSLNTGWELYGCNASSATPKTDTGYCITLLDSWQTLWASVGVDETKGVWLFANCSAVSSNPGVDIDLRATA